LRPGEPAANASTGIVWRGEPPGLDPALVGEEFACLSALAGLSCVQPGFCLTAPPFGVDHQGGLKPDVAALVRAYRLLSGRGTGPGRPVVIRARLAGTGPPPPSWVPAPWTFFNVAGSEAVTGAVIECLAPYASTRARSFRSAAREPASEVRMAVQVQPFIPAEVCATVSTSPPTGAGTAGPRAAGLSVAGGSAGGRRGTLLIQARWGLPEDSPGPAARDLVTLRRSDLVLTGQRIVPKNRMWAAGDGGVIEVDVPAPLRTSACLSDGHARQIAELGLEIESRLGRPVEAEVMLAAGRVYLAWCRRLDAGDQLPTGSRPPCDQEPS
jgi:hypothetical protein